MPWGFSCSRASAASDILLEKNNLSIILALQKWGVCHGAQAIRVGGSAPCSVLPGRTEASWQGGRGSAGTFPEMLGEESRPETTFGPANANQGCTVASIYL